MSYGTPFPRYPRTEIGLREIRAEYKKERQQATARKERQEAEAKASYERYGVPDPDAVVAMQKAEARFRTEADAISKVRMEVLYPQGSRDVDLMTAWERLPSEVSKELDKDMTKEEGLRDLTHALSNFLIYTDKRGTIDPRHQVEAWANYGKLQAVLNPPYAERAERVTEEPEVAEERPISLPETEQMILPGEYTAGLQPRFQPPEPGVYQIELDGEPTKVEVKADFGVWRGNELIGRVDPQTGMIRPIEPPDVRPFEELPEERQEQIEKYIKELEHWREYQAFGAEKPITPEGLERKAEVTMGAVKEGETLYRLPPVSQDIGRLISPGEQIVGEWVIPMAAFAMWPVTALGGWRALAPMMTAGGAKKAAAITLRALLAPIAGIEWTLGKTLPFVTKYAVGKPLKFAVVKPMQLASQGLQKQADKAFARIVEREVEAVTLPTSEQIAGQMFKPNTLRSFALFTSRGVKLPSGEVTGGVPGLKKVYSLFAPHIVAEHPVKQAAIIRDTTLVRLNNIMTRAMAEVRSVKVPSRFARPEKIKVKPEYAGEFKGIAITVDDICTYPYKFVLKDEELSWIRTAWRFLDDWVALAEKEGLEVPKRALPTGAHYWPRMVISKEGVAERVFLGVPSMTRGRPGWSKHLSFDLEGEGVVRGFEYQTDQLTKLEFWAGSVSRRIGDKRFADLVTPLENPASVEKAVFRQLSQEATKKVKAIKYTRSIIAKYRNAAIGTKLPANTLKALQRRNPALAQRIADTLAGKPTRIPTPKAVSEARIAQIEKLVARKGKLPAGEGTKEELRIELARLQAEKNITEFKSLSELKTALGEVESELGNRMLPYHGGARINLFPEWTTKQLDEIWKAYKAAVGPKSIIRPKTPIAELTPKQAWTQINKDTEILLKAAQRVAGDASKKYTGVRLGTYATQQVGVRYLEGHTFDIAVANEIKQALAKSAWQVPLGALSNVNAMFRFLQTGWDIGAVNIQLLPLAFYRPHKYAEAVVRSIHAMLDPRAFYRFTRSPEVQAFLKLHPTLSIGRLTEFTESMGTGGYLNKIFRGVKADKWGGLQLSQAFMRQFDTCGMYGRILPGMAFEKGIASRLSRGLITEAQATAERHEVDTLLNALTGVLSSQARGLPLTQRMFEGAIPFYAPTLFRSWVALFTYTLQGGMKGREARLALGQMLAGVHALTYGILTFQGKQPTAENNYRGINPMEGDYLGSVVGDVHIRFGTKMVSWIKLAARVCRTALNEPENLVAFDFRKNPGMQWLRGQMSPVAGAALSTLLKYNFIGEPADSPTNWLKNVMANLSLPFWLEEQITGEPRPSWVASLAEFFGLNAYAVQYWEMERALKDEKAQELYGVEYEDLPEHDPRRRVIDQDPEVMAISEETRKIRFERGDEFTQQLMNYMHEIDTYRKQRDDTITASCDAVRAGEYDVAWLRERIQGANSVYGTNYQSLESDPSYQQVFEYFNEPPDKKDEDIDLLDVAFNDWAALMYDPTLTDQYGDYNWEEADKRKATWLTKWGQEYHDMIQAWLELNRTDDPLSKVFRDSREILRPYWEAEIGEERLEVRRGNAQIEATLVLTGRITTIENPDTMALVTTWAGLYDIPDEAIPALQKVRERAKQEQLEVERKIGKPLGNLMQEDPTLAEAIRSGNFTAEQRRRLVTIYTELYRQPGIGEAFEEWLSTDLPRLLG